MKQLRRILALVLTLALAAGALALQVSAKAPEKPDHPLPILLRSDKEGERHLESRQKQPEIQASAPTGSRYGSQATPVGDKRPLTITAYPTHPSYTNGFIVGLEEPKLSGLVVNLGGAEYRYDTDFNVDFYIDYDAGTALGTKAYTLTVEYYTRDDRVYGTCPISFTGVSVFKNGLPAATALTLDKTVSATLNQNDGEYSFFSFTPESTDYYTFFGRNIKTTGGYAEIYAVLFDINGNVVAIRNYFYDEMYTGAKLNAGETYYLLVDYRYYAGGSIPTVKLNVGVYKGSSSWENAEEIFVGDTTVPGWSFYAFNPTESGYYTFYSTSTSGDPYLEIIDTDNWSGWGADDRSTRLFDMNFRYLGSVYGSLDFRITVYMEAGSSYLILADQYWRDWEDVSNLTYTLTIGFSETGASASGSVTMKDVAINVRQVKYYDAMFTDCSYDILILRTEGLSARLGWIYKHTFLSLLATLDIFHLLFGYPEWYADQYFGIIGLKPGTSTVTAYTYDWDTDDIDERVGSAAVTVSYDLIQWIEVVLLLGFIWLPIRSTFVTFLNFR